MQATITELQSTVIELKEANSQMRAEITELKESHGGKLNIPSNAEGLVRRLNVMKHPI